MSNTNVDTTTPLLNPPVAASGGGTDGHSLRSRSQRMSRRAGLRGAARLLNPPNSRGVMTEQSVRVRESAAQQLEERQSDWAYSTPIVVLDLIWNTCFLLISFVMMILSKDESSVAPLRLWIVGHGMQCVLHMVCVCVEYKRRREMNDNSDGNGELSLGSNLNLNSSSRNNDAGYPILSSNSSSSSTSSANVGGSYVDYAMERGADDNTSVVKHLESANTMFSFVWWILGFYWASSGGHALADDAPKLYWLTVTYLALDVFFVVICVAVACVIGIAVCCCLPCIIAILYAVADQQEGATKEEIERLPKYKFRRIGEIEKQNGDLQESFGGIMAECNTDTPLEHVLSLEDTECCVCLSTYEDENELRELPCCHHFHTTCVDKWLRINATCPLCKFNILKNGHESDDDEV